jgi:3-oxoacyl-[acyl-carrier-protein] synthase-3
MSDYFRKVRIAGTGATLPCRRVTSSELDAEVGKPEGWIEKHVGLQQRYFCGIEDQIDLGASAATDALADAECGIDDIDILVFAAAVPYQSIPATAPLLQGRLGMLEGGCASFDVNSTCLSFLTAVDLVSTLIENGMYRCGLVVASEIASRGLPWENAPLVAAHFGDGAAAAVLKPADGMSGGIVASRMETYPSGYEACRLGSGGTRYDFHRDRQSFIDNSLFEMDGKALYRHALDHFEPFFERLLADARWRRDEIDVVIPHQASRRALAFLVERCGIAEAKIVDIFSRQGNQVAASIPSALHEARRNGLLRPGTKALMLGTSAGISLGGIAFVA